MKKNTLISYKNLSSELLDLIDEMYPDGLDDAARVTDTPHKGKIYTIIVETEDQRYMVDLTSKLGKVKSGGMDEDFSDVDDDASREAGQSGGDEAEVEDDDEDDVQDDVADDEGDDDEE